MTVRRQYDYMVLTEDGPRVMFEEAALELVGEEQDAGRLVGLIKVQAWKNLPEATRQHLINAYKGVSR